MEDELSLIFLYAIRSEHKRGKNMPKHEITMTIRLPVKITKKKKWYVAACLILDVVSQGETEAKAKSNLREALFVFFVSCIERGTIHQVLNECGFERITVPAKQKPGVHDKREYINVPLELLYGKGHHDCHA